MSNITPVLICKESWKAVHGATNTEDLVVLNGMGLHMCIDMG